MVDQAYILIVLKGEIPPYHQLRPMSEKADKVICADGAADTLAAYGIEPDVVIGDMDSLASRALTSSLSHQFIQLEDQETTDGEKALNYCIEKGYKTVRLVGGFGKRIDHSLYNIELMKKFHAGLEDLSCYTAYERYFIIDGSTFLDEKPGTRVSISPVFGPVENLSLNGFEFNVRQVTLEFGVFSSLSNRISETPAVIEFDKGLLLIMISHSPDLE